MSVNRDQLATSHTTSESSTSQRNLDYIQRKVDEFKDGVTDAMIHGTKDEKKQGYFFYKQGYDFGITLFCKQEEWTHD